MKKRIALVMALTGVFALMVGTLAASGDSSSRILQARTLTGFEEVPVIMTDATGHFRARVSADGTSVDYELTYSGLEGDVTQAHIHLGQRGANGGIVVWLCGTALAEGPPGTPTCPDEGTVSGTFDEDDIVGPAGQGIDTGDFERALEAMRAGVTYVNVHSTMSPPGEIRGQINPRGR
jgi:hypothetical protein